MKAYFCDIISEKWKEIKGYPNYEISNMGRVRSKPREGTKGGIVKQFIRGGTYYKVKIYKDGKQFNVWTHRLVATHFIANPKNKPQVNHKDGNKLNNRADNLEWVTCSENLDHSYANGLRKTRKVAQYMNGVFIKYYLNCYRASKETGIDHALIWYCLNGKRKRAGGYEWKYAE